MNAKKIFLALISSTLLGINTLPILAEDNTQPPSEETPPDNQNGETPPDKPEGDAPGGQPGGQPGGGPNTQSYDYSGSYNGTLNVDGSEESSTGETISSEETDKNAILVQNGGNLTIENDTVNKTGDDTDGDSCNFYGVNSIGLSVGSNSLLKINNSSLTSDSEGSNAIFATDSATAYVNDSTISTSKGNSRGLDATYSGTIIANDTTITTQGDHSASVATDRGGGSVSITNSKLNTSGSGSPLLYSTGDIEADNVTGTASGSQIAGMEGYNTLLIYNSTLSSTNNAISGSDPIKNGVIIYQSTSGDADTSTSEKAQFQVSNSTLATSIDSGAMFYVTNTTANVVVSNSVLSFDSDNVYLLQASGNSSNNWGSEGSNGGNVTFTALKQNLSGNIYVDSISSADMYLLSNSTFTGNTSDSDEDATITMNIDSTSTWVLTSDSTITNLNLEDGGSIVDSTGKTVTIKQDGKTIVEGNSQYTLTITGTYSTTVTTSSDNELSTDFIDRSDFDATYNTSTTFSTNSTNVESTSDPVSTVSSSTEVTSNTNQLLYITIACVGLAAIVGGYVFHKTKK